MVSDDVCNELLKSWDFYFQRVVASYILRES